MNKYVEHYNHIVNYKKNFLANFCQIDNGKCNLFSKQIKSFHLCQNENKKQQIVSVLFQNASKCKMHFC